MSPVTAITSQIENLRVTEVTLFCRMLTLSLTRRAEENADVGNLGRVFTVRKYLISRGNYNLVRLNPAFLGSLISVKPVRWSKLTFCNLST